ncbi:hypothetical protein LTR16_005292, partial [Cryomyces antarcticus]
MTNFTECAARYLGNEDLVREWGYTGPVRGIPPNSSTQITERGCEALCGTGIDWYPWKQSSGTITTWVLPVIGMLLQAPFESNAVGRTVTAISRWVGSPMASLSYILWNIKVSGKCALMVDMAIRYDEHFQDKASDFGHIRDSFYILMTMNQYTMNPWIPLKKEAEGLLRIALFSKDLRLHKESRRLQEVRRDLAADLRGRRKRGAVPVYISTMWFLFSLGISIQSAFGYVGENATAHDLALGLMLAWMPVLILCSIVDRNPVAADDIRRKLNKLVDKVRASLVDDSIREDFINTFEHRPEGDAMKHWVTDIRNQCENMESFFVAFAGQGRVRYHHGVAHPILSDIESIYIAKHGRDWLRNEREARYNLVLGMPSDEGLLWFDFRELWQIASAVLIVGCTCLGAFILSYFTPTVGLGCRSFGYTVFASISFGLLICEGFVWWLASNARTPHGIARIRTRMVSNTAYQGLESRSIGFAKK